MEDLEKDKMFTLIQRYLRCPPVIIWGSGATVDYGMPTMADLNNTLASKFEFFDGENNNLEEELGKDKYSNDKLQQIRQHIWNKINECDAKTSSDMLSDFSKFFAIKQMIDKFITPDPKSLNIITTNYDRIIENVLSILNIDFTDGFTGRNLSSFDGGSFLFTRNNRRFVNVIKVHGSLDWFNTNGQVMCLKDRLNFEPEIIPPGKNKYREAFREPYRTLIQKSDEAISNAKAFLVVGFGFNDEHITPKIVNKVNEGVPIVIITKQITDSTRRHLARAEKYIFIEDGAGCSVIEYKNTRTLDKCKFESDFWRLGNFMEVFNV